MSQGRRVALEVKSKVSASRLLPAGADRKVPFPVEGESKLSSIPPLTRSIRRFKPGRGSEKKNSEFAKFLFSKLPPTEGEMLDDDEPSSAISIAQCLVDPNQVYRFRLVTYQTLTSSAAGVLSGFQTFNPASFTEYSSYLSSLFNQVRIVEARGHWTNVNPHADGYATGFQKYAVPFACDLGLTNTTPSSILIVYECPNSKLVQLASEQNTTLIAKITGNEFALTSSPVPGPYAGCYGQFQWYQSNLTVSTAYATLYFEAVYEFRSRT